MVLTKLKPIAPFFAAVLILSCSTSKNTPTLPSRDKVKGNWTLDHISYENLPAGTVKLTLLDEGTDACLTGSTWSLPNNGYGNYTIAATAVDCAPGQRDIVWSYQKEGDHALFQFKRLPGGVKAKTITDGYRFRILSAEDHALQLQAEVSFEGKTIYINYSFTDR